MRWKHFVVDVNNERLHISEVDLDYLDDEELLNLYERIVRQMSKVM